MQGLHRAQSVPAWVQAALFTRLWNEALQNDDDLIGLNFTWIALNGSLDKAPLGGKKRGPSLTDRAKGGVKRSLLTEARRLPVVLALDGANRHDVKLLESTLASLPPTAEAARLAHQAAGHAQGLCLDAGYDSKQVRQTLVALGYPVPIRLPDEEVQGKKAGQKARR